MPCSLRNKRGLLYPPAARRDYCAHAGRRRTTRPLREKLGQAGRTQGWVAAGSSTQNRLPWPGSESRHTAPPIRCIAVRTIASPMPVPGCLSSWCSRLSMSKICCCRSLECRCRCPPPKCAPSPPFGSAMLRQIACACAALVMTAGHSQAPLGRGPPAGGEGA